VIPKPAARAKAPKVATTVAKTRTPAKVVARAESGSPAPITSDSEDEAEQWPPRSRIA
jgi:hypothetical protein